MMTKLLMAIFLGGFATIAHAQTLSWISPCGGQIAVSAADVIYVSSGTGMCRYTSTGATIPTSNYADYPTSSVNGLAISSDGYVWVALDRGVARYSLEGDAYPGLELPSHSGYGYPFTVGVAADDQYVYVQVREQIDLRIAVYTHDGTLVKELPAGLGEGIAVRDGDVYACDRTANVVTVYSPDGAIVRCIGQGVLTDPHGVAVSANVVYILDANKVRAYTTAGAHLADWDVPALSTGIAVDSGGHFYVAGNVDGSPYVFKYAPQVVVPTRPATWGALKAHYR
jgi:hypothetical protein